MTEQRTVTTPRYPGYGIEADLADLLEHKLQTCADEDLPYGAELHARIEFCEAADAVLDLLRQKGIQIP